MANFLDTFTRAGLATAGLTDSGHSWADAGNYFSANAAAPLIVGDKLTASGGGGSHFWGGQPNWAPSADHSFSVRWQSVTGNTNYGGIGVRWLDYAVHGYLCEITDTIIPSNEIFLYITKNVFGVQTPFPYFNISGSQPYVVADATNVLVELRVVGSTLSAWLDGVMVWTDTDTDIPTGGTGLIGIDPTNASLLDALIDEVVGIDLSVAPSVFWTNRVKTTEFDA